MPDIVINPSLGKIDFFTVKGEQVTNSMRLGDASTILFTGALSASSITTGGGGAFVTSVQPTANYLSKFTGNSTIANSLVYDNGTNVGIGTTVPSASLHINSTTAGATLLRTDGTNGTLFSVVDDLSDSLMSVNNSAGLPVLEVFTDDRIVAGQYGQNDFVVINNKVGIGTNNPLAKLHVTGSSSVPSAIFIGNVGIGSTSPGALLDVNGLFRFQQDIRVNNGTDKLILSATSTTTELHSAGTTGIVFKNSGNNEIVRFDAATGNVGIGTTSPVQKLHIVGSTLIANGNYHYGYTLVGAQATLIGISASDNISVGQDNVNHANTYIYGGLGIIDLSTSGSTRMRVGYNGDVGIGTTTPDIFGRFYTRTIGFNSAGITVMQINGTSYGGIDIGAAGTRTFGITASGTEAQITTVTNIPLIFNINTATVMTLNSTGLGIGTSSPNSKLELYSTSWEPAIRLTSTSGSVKTYGLVVNPYWSTGSFHIYDYTTDNSRLQISTTGNVGIGVGASNPGYTLEVNGTQRVVGNFYLFNTVVNPASNFSNQRGVGFEASTGKLEVAASGSDALSIGRFGSTGQILDFRYAGTQIGNFSLDTNDLTLATARHLILSPTGNVGIGTTIPGRKLHLYAPQSVISLSNTGTGAWSGLQWSVGNGAYTAYSGLLDSDGRYFIDVGSNGEDFTILQNGNVGIGTTSPQYLLDLGTAGSANQLRARRIYVSGTGTGSGFTLDSTLIYQEAAGTFNITNPGSYPNVAFTINNSGNVGIGTTSPVALLAVTPSGSAFNSSNTMVAYFGKTTTNGYGSTFIRVARSDSTTTTGSNAEYTDIEHNSGGSGPFRYGTYVDTNIINGAASTNGVYGSINFVTSGSTRMTIAGGTSAGNVGIGTTNPAAMLHVQKSQNSETTVIINNTDDGTAAAARLDLQSHASNYLTLQAYGQNFSGNVCGIAGAKLNTILDNALTANSTGLLIGTTSTNPLYFATANAERMRIDSGGNVGIGTTTPFGTNANRTVLSVNGTTDVSLNIGSGGSQRAYLYGVSSYAELGTIGSLPLSFAPNNSEKMRLDVNGNLGIGTTSPAAKLYVVSSGGPIARFDGSSVATSGATEIDILGPQSNGDLNLGIGGSTFTDATNNIQNKAYITAGTGLSGLNLRSDAGYVQITAGGLASSYEVARFTSAGNVGIGTTVTAAKLHINSTTAGATLLRTDGTSGTLFSVVDDLSDSLMSVNNSAGLPVLEVFADDRIVGGQYGQNDLVVVNNKVGIGTNNPLAKLHVTGSASTPAAVFLGDVGIGTTAPTAQSNYRFLQVNGPTSAVIETTVGGTRIGGFDSTSNTLYVGSIGSFPVVFRTAVDEKMRISANGNVGIGFTSPAANLHVFGPTMIVGDSNTTQNVRQTIVGSTTGNASTTAKKIFVCGHTSTGTITVTAIITSVSTASATATFSFANAFGNNVTPNRLSYISLNSTITSIDCSYNNSGYQMEIAVTYTGATAPTLYFTAEGMGSSIWTL